MKKIAYVHDRIVYPGGAENVLKDLIDESLQPEDQAVLFTLFSPHRTFHTLKIVTALPRRINTFFQWTQKHSIPVLSGLFDYRNLMPFYPLLCGLLSKKIQQFAPDQCSISSFAAAKNVVPFSGWQVPTNLYLHSPNQYIRENYQEYTQKLTGYKKSLFVRCSSYLRTRDSKLRHYDHITSNSNYTKQLAVEIYEMNRESITVQYPTLPKTIQSYQAVQHPENYFLFIGRLVTFVRELDRIIALTNELEFPLLVMGDGPDREQLQALAGPTITFLGSRDHTEKYEILSKARGLINLTKESCGIVTMEAIRLGVPVFGYNAGGTAELVTHGINGWLVESKEHQVLMEEFEKFQQVKFTREGTSISE